MYIYFLIIKMERISKIEQTACDDCTKKTALIEKYLQLIDLLKIKTERSMLSSTLKKSLDAGTTSNTSDLHSNKFYCEKIYLFSMNFITRRKLQAFQKIRAQCREKQIRKAWIFANKINTFLGKRKHILFTNISKATSSGKIQNAIFQQKTAACQKYILQLISSPTSTDKQQKINSVKKNVNTNGSIKDLSKKLFSLSMQNQKLKFLNKKLIEEIEESNRRQEIQSKKKKDSLEMLAQEMGQKNEIIMDLQTTIKAYEQKQNRLSSNVLEEESVFVRKQLQKLQKINDKLNYDIEKKNLAYNKLKSQLEKMSSHYEIVKLQNTNFQETIFTLHQEIKSTQAFKQENIKLTCFLQNKIKQMKKQEKHIIQAKRTISNIELRQRNRKKQVQLEENMQINEDNKSRVQQFEAKYKLEKVLNFLYNMSMEDSWLESEYKLFDQEEVKVLEQVRLKFKGLIEQNLANKDIGQRRRDSLEQIQYCRLRQPKGETDEIHFNEYQVEGSIFEVFNNNEVSPYKEMLNKGKVEDRCIENLTEFNQTAKYTCVVCQNKQKQPPIMDSQADSLSEHTVRKTDRGITIKLLEMEIQKNKQVEKISDMKNKIFHIRSLILNFLKTIDLNHIRHDSKDILDVMFEIFQYSEEEKNIIFNFKKKEKRFFGFI